MDDVSVPGILRAGFFFSELFLVYCHHFLFFLLRDAGFLGIRRMTADFNICIHWRADVVRLYLLYDNL